LTLVASSAMFIGVSVLVATLEIVWLSLRDSLTRIKSAISSADAIVAAYEAAQQAKEEAIAANTQLKYYADPDYRKRFATAQLSEGIQAYISQMEQSRPVSSKLSEMKADVYQRHQRENEKISLALAESQKYLRNETLAEIISSIFPNQNAVSTNEG
jgi:hypothetical protein